MECRVGRVILVLKYFMVVIIFSTDSSHFGSRSGFVTAMGYKYSHCLLVHRAQF